MYTFEKVDFDEVSVASRGLKIVSTDLFEDRYDFDRFALFFGKCLALFGNPNKLTKEYENMFIYCLKAVGDDGRVLYLCPHHGANGPAVYLPSPDNGSGLNTMPYLAAIRDLCALVGRTPAYDYEWKCHSTRNAKAYIYYKVVNDESFSTYAYMDETTMTDPEARRIYEETIRGYY